MALRSHELRDAPSRPLIFLRAGNRQSFHAAFWIHFATTRRLDVFDQIAQISGRCVAALGVPTVWRTTVKLPSSMREPASVGANSSKPGFSPASASSFSRMKCSWAAFDPAICTSCAFLDVRLRYRSNALFAGETMRIPPRRLRADANGLGTRRHEVGRFDLGQRRCKVDHLRRSGSSPHGNLPRPGGDRISHAQPIGTR